MNKINFDTLKEQILISDQSQINYKVLSICTAESVSIFVSVFDVKFFRISAYTHH